MGSVGGEGSLQAEGCSSGDVDVWSDAVSSHAPDHLLVMVHGILGSTADWQYAANEFVKQLPDDVIVHCSEKNMNTLTLDGVDIMGERLTDEVIDVISRKPELTKISFLAHSVGGLVARYAIAKLYRHPSDTFDGKTKGTIYGLEAMNFITVATPHLGSQGNKQVPLLFGSITMEKVASRMIHWIFRRTGKHLFLLMTMRENHHCCSVWLKIMAIFTLYLLCEHLSDEWLMLMQTVITLLAGEHRLSEETLSFQSGRNLYPRSTPTLYMRNTPKNSMMKNVKIHPRTAIQTYWKVSYSV
ncbi:hypothetical protein GUJ93_ZPchr0010g7631 [Zizania palustris]|uniref:DUF676 domain-containing protein n=1 Tax=Zizania palustris TaxID=103762 RepID=A0A8J5WB29_ZIZPA|nr:hypothetical protein GUJ93_ZPchr0010g7631 [Zizania palustris]